MNTAALRRDAVDGLAGGIVMAMWSMIVMGLSGTGFWTPLNLIAHTFYARCSWAARSADGTTHWHGRAPGDVDRTGYRPGRPVTAIGGWATTTAGGPLAGMAFGLIVWLVMQYLVWDAIDPAAAERSPPGCSPSGT